MVILSPAKKLICRRRRNSDTLLPVTVQYGGADGVQQAIPNNDVSLEPWDAWEDDSQKQNKNKSHFGRNKSMSESEPEADVDYFQDMQPEIRRTTKIVIRKKNENVNKNVISNRLAVSSGDTFHSSELDSWEEPLNAWDDATVDDLSYEAEIAIKEKKKLERQERHLEQLRKKQERESVRGMKRDSQLAAVKLS